MSPVKLAARIVAAAVLAAAVVAAVADSAYWLAWGGLFAALFWHGHGGT